MDEKEQKSKSKKYIGVPRFGFHLGIPIPIREKLEILSAQTGREMTELILDAIVAQYFSGAPAVIQPPAKGE